MSEHSPFPTYDEVMAVPWEDAAAEAEFLTCSKIADILFRRAAICEEAGQVIDARSYRFVAQLAFIHLEPHNEDAPLRPAIIMQSGRSSAPEDFDDATLGVVAQLMSTSKISALRARFGDILWVRKKDYMAAQEAASHYLEAFKLVDAKGEWAWDIDSLERGMALARVLGKKKSTFKDYVSFIIGRLNEIEHSCADAYGTRLLTLLTDQRAGDPKRLAVIAESIASRMDKVGSTSLAHNYYDIAARCHELTSDVTEAKRVKRRKGDSLVELANECIKKPEQGYLSGTHHLAVGIECLRQGGEDEARVTKLHKTLREWQVKSAGEMKTFTTEMDVSEMIELARKHVSGKSLRDAIFAMGVGHQPVDCKALRQRVIDHMDQFPLSSLFGASFMAPDGRVLANKPSGLTTDEDVREAAIQAEMFHQAAQIDWGLRAHAYIDVCRREILMEHRPTHNDLAFLVLQNPFIPPGHEALFLKGIIAGFRGDFDIAAHLLVPQVEESVRHILTAAGHVTSKLDAKLIQEQRLLGTLLAMPETVELFGADHVFELRGLLCDKFGRDLRNRLAHGFVTYNECWGDDVLNLWWLVMRFLCIPVMQRSRHEEEERGDHPEL